MSPHSDMTSDMIFPGIIKLFSHQFKNLSQAINLASLLAHYTPHHAMTSIGLTEIFFNAIEHGNLNIGHYTKSSFTDKAKWLEEINNRLKNQINLQKEVYVTTEITPHYVKFTICDQGNGFDFEQYENKTAMPITSLNGRGILIAKQTAFNQLTYFFPGNRVECIIYK